jgi:phenylacetate-CoA ligase
LSPHYQLEVSRSGFLDSLLVRVELKSESCFDQERREAAARTLVHLVKSYVGISVDVAIVNPNAIERSVGKAKRVIDNREKAQ